MSLESAAARPPAALLEGVSFSYPGSGGAPALSGIDLAVAEGEFVALAGPNGSGKSTLCRLLNGLMLPAAGRVVSCGMDTRFLDDIPRIRRAVGLVMQNPDNQIAGPTVEDDVAFGLENFAVPREEMRARVEDALAATDLTALRGREPHLLSLGERKRLALAGVLALEPRLLVSDESTSMLDPQTRSRILGLFLRLRDERGTTVVHATHRPEEMLAADRVVFLSGGRLAFAGSPEELFSRRDLAEEYGLVPPGIFRLARELEAAGFSMPAKPLSADEVVARL